ncbi:MFS transporter, partial [Escherichia coli]|nr:MFS transporter [Escherichia coli]
MAIIAALGGLLFGYDTGIISGALLYIQRSFELTPGQESTVTAMLLVGAAIGAFLGGRVADSLGRRGTILLGAVGFII